jgi:competence protein ComEC
MGTYAARELRQVLAEEQIAIVTVQDGQELDLGKGARLQVLSANKRGAVLLLEWDRFRLLLPIGLDFEGMEALVEDKQQGPVTALLLAESGYAPLNPPDWIARWNPQVVLLSVAADDRDGLPDVETLEAVEGYTLLRTDQNGWIQISTDGEQMWVEVER